MRIPDGVNKQHVVTAMDQIGVDPAMWPARSQSTKHDVVDPRSGARFPPKLVLSTAAQIATGQQLSRRKFSGGAQTNGRLKDLGFVILPKHSDRPSD